MSLHSKSCTRGMNSGRLSKKTSHFCLEQNDGLTLSLVFKELTAGSADSASLLPMGQHPSDQRMEDSLDRGSCSRELLE